MDQAAAAPSRGHTIDHFGLRMPDLLARAATLKAQRGAHLHHRAEAGTGGAVFAGADVVCRRPVGCEDRAAAAHGDV